MITDQIAADTKHATPDRLRGNRHGGGIDIRHNLLLTFCQLPARCKLPL
jgi:hypothetical protein